MRETRFSTRHRHGSPAPARLVLAAGAAAALIAAPVSVSPHALALSWRTAAAKIVSPGQGNGRVHGDDSQQNASAHGNAFGRCDERGQATALEASAGRVQDGRGLHQGCAWDDDGNLQDSAPVDDEAPPS